MSEELTPPNVDVKVEIILTKEDLIKKKYADQERVLDNKEDGIQKAIKEESKKRDKASATFEKVLAAGTDAMPAEFESLSTVFQALGNETDGGSSRSLHQLNPAQMVTLTDGTELQGNEDSDGEKVYYIAERRMIAYRPQLGDDSHERPQYVECYHDRVRRLLTDEERHAMDSVLELENRVKELNEELVEVKKAISQLPKLMRQAEAAVIDRILERTAEGKMMLEAVNSVQNLLEE
jgi:hypothetical protein